MLKNSLYDLFGGFVDDGMLEIFWKEIASIILGSLDTSTVVTKLSGKMTGMQIIDVVTEAITYCAWHFFFFSNFLCLAFLKTLLLLLC